MTPMTALNQAFSSPYLCWFWYISINISSYLLLLNHIYVYALNSLVFFEASKIVYSLKTQPFHPVLQTTENDSWNTCGTPNPTRAAASPWGTFVQTRKRCVFLWADAMLSGTRGMQSKGRLDFSPTHSHNWASMCQRWPVISHATKSLLILVGNAWSSWARV